MDFNNIVFDAIRSDCRYGQDNHPELNMSFGWTVKIANPVWIHFGPGVTGKMYYGTYSDNKYPKKGYGKEEWQYLDVKKMGYEELLEMADKLDEAPDKYKDAWTKANYAIAVSPVIGLTVKYSYFAIRGTYQYRWPIKKELKDFIGASRFSVGVGIAF